MMTEARQLAWEAWEGFDPQIGQLTHSDLSIRANQYERSASESEEPKERTRGLAYRMLEEQMQGKSGRLEQRIALVDVVRTFEGAAHTVIKDEGGDPSAVVDRDPDGATRR